MPVEKVENTLTCTATFDANLPANSVKPVNMTLDPLVGAQSVLQVPMNESWVIEDIYVTGSQTPDAIVEIYRNDLDVVAKTDPINTLLVSNPSRPRYGKKVYGPNDRLSMRAINLAAIGTAAATITFYVKLVRFVRK
jgi:hypothetical protein